MRYTIWHEENGEMVRYFPKDPFSSSGIYNMDSAREFARQHAMKIPNRSVDVRQDDTRIVYEMTLKENTRDYDIIKEEAL